MDIGDGLVVFHETAGVFNGGACPSGIGAQQHVERGAVGVIICFERLDSGFCCLEPIEAGFCNFVPATDRLESVSQFVTDIQFLSGQSGLCLQQA